METAFGTEAFAPLPDRRVDVDDRMSAGLQRREACVPERLVLLLALSTRRPSISTTNGS